MTPQSTRSPVWHPFTQHALEGEMLEIASAQGAWLTTRSGQRILDAISSWWVVTHGHCHPDIVAAIQSQAALLDQVIFAGFTHEPAERVARDLTAIAPSGLSHVFFSDSGSTSVEVALKMALGFWRNVGDAKRTRILALEHAYHGDTIGTMSAGARGVFNAAYEPLLFDVGRIPFPKTGAEKATFEALQSQCETGTVAALIVEPLICGAGGMLIYSDATLAEMARICADNNVLLIADEVMTGFGRTGAMFACNRADVTPDIMCVAKGLTGGSIPLAATLCTDAIYKAHYSSDRSKTFFHSSSYTANPIACAAAAANLEIWKTGTTELRISTLTEAHASLLSELERDARFTNPRQIGTIAAIDLAVSDAGYLANVGLTMRKAFVERGVLLRPLGNTIYIMPPYCIEETELADVYAAITAVAREVLP
ncbi:MAG: adenosylmethionine--8-amino-7-oxononanoate transaminase [Hyphomicrobiaceae bacterium]|nr:adenosylmethionine--8-amino-7-oxononanoate transaminase [Hyphomicrobiaceae bacterium]